MSQAPVPTPSSERRSRRRWTRIGAVLTAAALAWVAPAWGATAQQPEPTDLWVLEGVHSETEPNPESGDSCYRDHEVSAEGTTATSSARCVWDNGTDVWNQTNHSWSPAPPDRLEPGSVVSITSTTSSEGTYNTVGLGGGGHSSVAVNLDPGGGSYFSGEWARAVEEGAAPVSAVSEFVIPPGGEGESMRISLWFNGPGGPGRTVYTYRWDGAGAVTATPPATTAGTADGSEAGVEAGVAAPPAEVATGEDGAGGGFPLPAIVGIGAAVIAILISIIARLLRTRTAAQVLDTLAPTSPVGPPTAEGGDADDEQDRDVEVVLELTHPAGVSPVVFTDGWVFSARAVADPGGPGYTDLSNQVRWSGSGTFEPAIGYYSRPVFSAPGPNTIELTVTHRGQTVTRRFVVEAVTTALYAHVQSLASSPADSHGCPACPHPVVGPIQTGSPNVYVRELPAARVGDRGIHAACCGGNTFEITAANYDGEPRPLIDGRLAAKLGDTTQHCGGVGQIISVTPSDES